MNIVVISLDFTDFGEASGPRILEFGCVEMDDMLPTGRVFHCYFNPQQSVGPTNLYSSGIADKSSPVRSNFSEDAQHIIEFISDSKIVSHNAISTMRCLNCEMERCGLPPFHHDRIIDTLSIARESFPFIGNSVDELRSVLGIPGWGSERKDALKIAELLSEIFQKLNRKTDKNNRLAEQIALVFRNSNISNLSALGAAELIDSAADRFLNGTGLNDLPDEVFVFREISEIFRRLAENTNHSYSVGRDDVECLKQEIIGLRIIIDRLVEAKIKSGKVSGFDSFLENFCGVLGKSSALVVLGAAGYFLSTYAPKSLDRFAEILLKVYRDTGS